LKLALAGAEAARAALATGGMLPLDEAEKLFDQQVRLQLKFDAAIESQLKPLSFLRLFFQLQHQKLRLELEKQRLGERAKEAERRHELALLREQRAQQREQQRELRERQRREARAARPPVRRRERIGAFDPLVADAKRYALAERIARSPLRQLTWRTAVQQPAPRPVIHTQELIEMPGANIPLASGSPRPRPASTAAIERPELSLEEFACSA
jgi:hypothetical protein